MKMEADKTKRKLIQKMDENIAVFDNIQQRAEKLAKSLKSLKAIGQYYKLFTAIKVEKSDIQSLDANLDKAANDNAVADFKFQPCKELEELLKFKHSLGNICQQDSDASNTASLGKQVQKDSDTTNTTTSQMENLGKKISQDSVNSKATKVGEINVKTDGDTKKCVIKGLVSLQNGRLVATDGNNQNVKLIDVHQARVVSALPVPDQHWDMTETSEHDEIALTLGGLKKILVVTVAGDSLLKHREIKTSSTCYGIASVKGNLVVGLDFPVRLEIIDKHGTVLHRIEHDQKKNRLFKEAWSIAANHQGNTFYVSDSVENTVTCLSASGELKAVHRHSELRGARCAAVDYRGAVYVGGGSSSNILVLQTIQDSSKVKVLLSAKDGISTPKSLCYTADDCLFVGQIDDSLLIYQLS